MAERPGKKRAGSPASGVLEEDHRPRAVKTGDVAVDRLLEDPGYRRIFEAYSEPGREFRVVAFLKL